MLGRVTGTVLALLCLYIFLLSKRLNRSRFSRTLPFSSTEQLLKSSEDWKTIDVLQNSGVDVATNKRYIITGASGSFGVWLVQILQQRRERKIYCLDLVPPPEKIQTLEGVHFIRCDITNPEEVEQAFRIVTPDVVFHLAAVIRFWERARFTYRYSEAVNVKGTENVINALGNADPSSEKILLYCSSAAVVLPEPFLMRLGHNFKGYASTYTLSDDRSIPDEHRPRHDYAKSKTEADYIVRKANGVNGLKTGVLRPGMTVCSPTDPVFGATMRQYFNPIFGGSYAQNTINSQDLVSAFLKYESKMREKPQEVSGDAFLVTGDHELWTWTEQMIALQAFSKRDLRIIAIHPLPLYIIAHIVEWYCFLRHYLLLPVYRSSKWGVPTPHPTWMVPLRLHELQPAMWNTLCSDVEIDDSRARRVLGYRNLFSNAQTLRWIAETAESSGTFTYQKVVKPRHDPLTVPDLGGFVSVLKEE